MVVLQGWCFELGFMPRNHYSGSDTSRPEMGIMGIMNRARGMRIVENGFHVRVMFLLLGLLLSVLNLPIASGQPSPLPPLGNPEQPAVAPPPPPPTASLDPPPSGVLPPPPPGGLSVPPPEVVSPPTVVSPPAGGLSGPPPPSVGPSPAPTSMIAPPVESPPSPALDPPPPPPPSTTIVKAGDTWNESEKAGVVIASIAALLQVAVVAFLLIKRHQMLTTVEYDDIDDSEYDTPRASNFRDIESA